MRPSNVSIEPDTPRKSIPPSNEDLESYIFGSGQAIDLPKKLTFLQQIFSFPAMLASLLVGAVFVPGRKFLVDPDIWWHLKVGATILATHHWPTTDPYSFTVFGNPWVAHEWLGDVLFAAVYRAGGTLALEALLIALGSAVVLSLYALGTLRSGNSKAGFLAATVLLVLTTISFTMRPQMLGYLFLVLTLIALERFRQGKRGVWWLPVLMVVWVNTHASWITGLGVILAYWLGGLTESQIGDIEIRRWTDSERRTIACVFLLSLIALAITPYGTRLAAFPFEAAFSMPLSVKYIWEYQPIPFNLLPGKLFLVLFLGTVLLQAMFRFRWRLEEFVLFLFGAMMACLHVRFLLLFVPLYAPILATILARWMPAYDRTKDKFYVNAALMASVAASLVYFFPSRTDIQKSIANQFPVAAVQYLRSHPIPGRVFNSWDFGAYLLWAEGPEHKVFLDGRSEIYEPAGILSDYMYISRIEPGALAVLNLYHVQYCLLARDEPLATLLSGSPEWHRVYFDDVSTVFVRNPTTVDSTGGEAQPLSLRVSDPESSRLRVLIRHRNS
jgi:hypothetical protein